jgi:hypothetical protein
MAAIQAVLIGQDAPLADDDYGLGRRAADADTDNAKQQEHGNEQTMTWLHTIPP